MKVRRPAAPSRRSETQFQEKRARCSRGVGPSRGFRRRDVPGAQGGNEGCVSRNLPLRCLTYSRGFRRANAQ